MFTTPKSWKIPYFYSTTTFTKAWLWQKNIVFISQLRGLHCDNWEKGFRSFCYYLHYVVMKRNFFFHFVATFTPQLYREKSFFFHVVATFTTPWSRYNTFFSTSALYWLLHSHIIKKFDSYCTTTLTTLCSWKKKYFFYFTATFTMQISFYIILHVPTTLTTSLTCRKGLQTISYPQRYVELKNFLFQKFEWNVRWFSSRDNNIINTKTFAM